MSETDDGEFPKLLRVDDLEDQADVSERIACAFESFQSGGDGAAHAELADLEEELTAREERIEGPKTEPSEYREMDAVRDEVVSSARTILRQMGATEPEAVPPHDTRRARRSRSSTTSGRSASG